MCQSNEFLPSLIPVHQNDHLRGALPAEMVLVKYGDFQCSDSIQVYGLIRELLSQYAARLCFVYRHLPQPKLHPRAQILAEAAEAAGAQGQFWGMHDLLFEHPDAVEDADLLEYAIALQLDIPQFLQELTDRVHRDRVQADMGMAQTLGITQTPTCWIGFQHQGAGRLIEKIQGAIGQ